MAKILLGTVFLERVRLISDPRANPHIGGFDFNMGQNVPINKLIPVTGDSMET